MGENYSGYGVAEGYSAYDPKKWPRQYTLVDYGSHVRRKCFDIMKVEPIAKEAVKRIAEMYHLESEAKQSTDPSEALAEARRTLSGPAAWSHGDVIL